MERLVSGYASVSASLASVEIFQHVRVVMGIVLGLAITRLLTGLARFVQHPVTARPILSMSAGRSRSADACAFLLAGNPTD